MSDRLAVAFQRAREQGRAALIPYLTAVVESGMGRGGVGAILEGPAGEEIRKLQARLEREVGGTMEQQR